MKKTILKLLTIYLSTILLIPVLLGENGIWGDFFATNSALKILIYALLMIHITITSMSLSFHRFHTHKGVILNKYLDMAMQLNLWFVGGMSKLDWVSVHIYHHAHSDKEKDPHSPIQKGLMHVLFLGVWDYNTAKKSEPVLAIRKTLKTNKLEDFIANHTLLGVIILTFINLILFGPFFGSILSLINFSVSPIFAVGGVNGLAHWFGYKNHAYHDNSRNLGFLLPLNFLICGELDHNNHHAHPRSCSFRHKWFEFDWGYFYIKILERTKLALIKNAYTTSRMKVDISKKLRDILDHDHRFKAKLEELSRDLNLSYHELAEKVLAYAEGKKVDLSRDLKKLVSEMKRTVSMNMKLELSY